MEQEKLYVIEEKTYEAHIDEEDVYKRQLLSGLLSTT